MNASLDTNYTALQDYVTPIERVDFANPKTSEKKIYFSTSPCTTQFFQFFSTSKIHCNKTLTISLDAQFNGLWEQISQIQKTDFENPEKSGNTIHFRTSVCIPRTSTILCR